MEMACVCNAGQTVQKVKPPEWKRGGIVYTELCGAVWLYNYNISWPPLGVEAEYCSVPVRKNFMAKTI